MEGPFFSVVVSSYNRAEIVSRCVRSVLANDDDDYEIVVVDDGSTDDTEARLAAEFPDPRLRVIALGTNHGMSEARRVGCAEARGRWLVTIDSDWELEPFALSRMREVIADTDPAIRILWFRMRWDDGSLSPEQVPQGVVTYVDKLRWWEGPYAADAVRCARREIYDVLPYHQDRRGAMDTLYELELARIEPCIYVEDVIAIQHADAPNSWLRAADPRTLIPRLRREAPDMLWMSETTLERHGDALAVHAPTLRRLLVRTAAVQAFILGRRLHGLRRLGQAIAERPTDPVLWATGLVGILGSRATLQAIITDRRLAARRRSRETAAA